MLESNLVAAFRSHSERISQADKHTANCCQRQPHLEKLPTSGLVGSVVKSPTRGRRGRSKPGRSNQGNPPVWTLTGRGANIGHRRLRQIL
jgi:hypothetical protein